MSTAAPAPVAAGPARPRPRPPASLADYARAGGPASRSGELGSLPIVVGLIIIAIVFQAQNIELPDRRQLRQPDRPDGARSRSSAWASSSCCCSARSTCRSATSAAWRGVIAALLLLPDGNDVPDVRSPSPSRSAPGVAIGTAPRADHHQDRRSRRSWSRWPACSAWNGVVLLLIGSQRHGRPPEQLHHRPRQRLPDRRGCAWILVLVSRRAVRRRCSSASAAQRASAGLATDPCCSSWPAHRRAGRRAGDRRRSTWATRTAASRTSPARSVGAASCSGPSCSAARASAATSTRSAATPRRRGARASTSTRIRIAVLRDLLDHGGARRHRARLAPALGRHERRRRLDPAVLDRRRGDRRHVAVRRPRHDEERGPRRARDRARSTTGSACSA